MHWKGFQRPQRVEVDNASITEHLRPLLRSAVRARVRHHRRQRPAPGAAVLDRRRGHHRDPHRGRAARVLVDLGRGRGRLRHHPQPQADPDPPAQRRAQDHRHRGPAARAWSRPATSSPIRRSRSSTPSTSSRPSTTRACSSSRPRSRTAAASSRPTRTSTRSMGIGWIPIDSVHSPVRKVNYTVESARVGRDHRLREADDGGVDQRHHPARGRGVARRHAAQGPPHHLHPPRREHEGGAARRRAGRSCPGSTRCWPRRSTSSTSRCARRTA